ncbi:MAG: hypothetical protein F4Z77_00200 [Dehalococcoidia bacterium]|nr:hypothetical protein [Dehalococcoidia bacterium]MYA52813.1 hypothetical protein [Dehalococcoidia bacterium]
MSLCWVALVVALLTVAGLSAEGASAQSPQESTSAIATIEVTVWRSTSNPSLLYLSTRPEEGDWATQDRALDMSHLSASGRFHQSSAVGVEVPLADGAKVAVEVTVWRSVSNPSLLYLSTRPEGGSWVTQDRPLDMLRVSSSGRFHQSRAVRLAVPLAEPLGASPDVEWLFAHGISSRRQSEIRQEMADIVMFVAQRFGASASGFTVSVGSDDPGWSIPAFMATTASFWDAAHEYFHVVQSELAGGGPKGPHWLVEGSATYAEEAYDGDLEFRRAIAPAAASHIASIRETESADWVRLNYHLGFLAVDWLVGHAGERSLLQYYRFLPDHDRWEAAFEAAFGLTIDEFYERFEEHRTRVAPPLPHLMDDTVAPVAAFVGNVPERVRSQIQAEMNDVHAFLVERFGAEGTEYSIYVGADWENVAEHHRRLSMNLWWDDRIRSHSLPLPWAPSCLSGATGWVVHVTSCGYSLGHSVYINSHLRVLLEEKEQLDLPPLWMEAGAGAYITLAYAAPVDDELSWHRAVVQRSDVPLVQLATTDGWEAAEGIERLALSTVAVDWLLWRAGELALFDYFRLLPQGTLGLPSLDVTAASAFEEAFGLTLDEFYGHFDDYRSTLTDD